MSKKYRSADDHPYWETVKTLPTFKEKVEYTWENWNIPILSVVVVLFIIISIVVTNVTNNIPSYLTGAYINLFHLDDAAEQPAEYLTRTFLQDGLGYSPDERITMRCVTDMTLDLSGEATTAETSYATINQLDSMIPAQDFDYFIMTSDLVKWLHSRYGETFLDLRTFLTGEELEQYADRLYYSQDGVPVGIDISDSTLLADMCFSADQSVCFVWFNYVKETDRMRPFFDYVMNTLP